jgi:hypothetical protein
VRDCFLPAALWPRLLPLGMDRIAFALLLWARADRDGIAHLSFAEDGHDLQRVGYAITYRGLDGVGWAWIPDVAVHAPPQPLRRPVEEGWPAPSPDAVRALLTARLGREATDAECRLACPRAYGKRRAASPPMGDHVDRVYRAWAAGQVDKDGEPLALPDSPSPGQRKMIQGAMKESAKDPAEAADALILIFQYVYGADEKPAKYLRGQNREGRAYVGLDNLTVTSKVQSRLAFARAWAANKPPPPAPGEMEGVTLGPLGRFR